MKKKMSTTIKEAAAAGHENVRNDLTEAEEYDDYHDDYDEYDDGGEREDLQTNDDEFGPAEGWYQIGDEREWYHEENGSSYSAAGRGELEMDQPINRDKKVKKEIIRYCHFYNRNKVCTRVNCQFTHDIACSTLQRLFKWPMPSSFLWV